MSSDGKRMPIRSAREIRGDRWLRKHVDPIVFKANIDIIKKRLIKLIQSEFTDMQTVANELQRLYKIADDAMEMSRPEWITDETMTTLDALKSIGIDMTQNDEFPDDPYGLFDDE